jgi:hypothetical protein
MSGIVGNLFISYHGNYFIVVRIEMVAEVCGGGWENMRTENFIAVRTAESV